MLRVAFRAVAARSAQSASPAVAAARPLLVLTSKQQQQHQIHTSALRNDQSTGAESVETAKKLATKARKASSKKGDADGQAPATTKRSRGKAATTKTAEKKSVGRPKGTTAKPKVKKPSPSPIHTQSCLAKHQLTKSAGL